MFGCNRAALYSAEHLTSFHVEAAKILPGVAPFHPEFALPAPDRAELADYAGSGYYRGHKSPIGDLPDRFSNAQSFSLANMAPQVNARIAGVWEGSESAARHPAVPTATELRTTCSPRKQLRAEFEHALIGQAREGSNDGDHADDVLRALPHRRGNALMT